MSMEDAIEDLGNLARKAIRERDTYLRQRDELVEKLKTLHENMSAELDPDHHLCEQLLDIIIESRIKQEDTKQ